MGEHILLGVQETVHQLGTQVGDKYVLHDETVSILESMNRRLNEDDKTLRTYRRALAFSNVIEKDLIPILLNCKPENRIVFNSVVKLLVNLSLPAECILPVHMMSVSAQSDRQTALEINGSLAKTKVLFSNSLFSRAFMDHLSGLIEKNTEKQNSEDIMTISNCLVLIRNILHIPDRSVVGGKSLGQNQLIWNLFVQNLDKVMLELISHKTASLWCTTIAQIIALMFKDQHVVKLEKLVQVLLDTSLESSEDGESNTNHHSGGKSLPHSRDSVSSLEVFPASPSPSFNSLADDENFEEDDVEEVEQGYKDEEMPLAVVGETDVPPIPDQKHPVKGAHEKLGTRFSDDKSQLSALSSGIGSALSVDIREEDQSTNGGRKTAIASNEYCDGKRGVNSPAVNDKTICEVKRIITNLVNSEDGIRGNGKEDKEVMDPSHPSSSGGNDDGAPPQKKMLLQDEKQGIHVIYKNSDRPVELGRKGSRGGGATNSHGARLTRPADTGNGSDSSFESSEITGVPKKVDGMGCSTDYGFGRQNNLDSQAAVFEDSVSSTEEDLMLQRSPKSRAHPVKPKPRSASFFTPQEKMLNRRLKILKRSQENLMRIKAMHNHVAQDNDVSELLREFTVAFIISGYSKLIRDLLTKFAKNGSGPGLDKSHLLWLLTYFLKFACPIELGLEEICSVLSVETIGYITYEGVEIAESLEVANREPGTDTSSHIRRMHLVVTAIREFIQSLSNYIQVYHNMAMGGTNLNSGPAAFSCSDDVSDAETGPKEYLEQVQGQTVEMKSLRQLLLFLIRSFDQDSQSNQYLGDLVSCNHLILGNMRQDTLQEHLRQFANTELMLQYGVLLADYSQNNKQLNENVLTMLHHVAGDLDSPHSLHNPAILNTFKKMIEERTDVCADWGDLIHYVIQSFLKRMIENNGLVDQGNTQAGSSIVMDMDTKEEEEHSDSTDHDVRWFVNRLEKQGLQPLIQWLQDFFIQATRVKLTPKDLVLEEGKVQDPVLFYCNFGKQSLPLVPYDTVQSQGVQTEAFLQLLVKLGFILPTHGGQMYPRIPYNWTAEQMYEAAAKLGPISANCVLSADELERFEEQNPVESTPHTLDPKMDMSEEKSDSPPCLDLLTANPPRPRFAAGDRFAAGGSFDFGPETDDFGIGSADPPSHGGGTSWMELAQLSRK